MQLNGTAKIQLLDLFIYLFILDMVTVFTKGGYFPQKNA